MSLHLSNLFLGGANAPTIRITLSNRANRRTNTPSSQFAIQRYKMNTRKNNLVAAMQCRGGLDKNAAADYN